MSANDDLRALMARCFVLDGTGESLHTGGKFFGITPAILTELDQASGVPLVGEKGSGDWERRSFRWHDLQQKTEDGRPDRRLSWQTIVDWGGPYKDSRYGDSPFGQQDHFTSLNRSTRYTDTAGRVALTTSHLKIVGSEDKRYAAANAIAELPMTKAGSGTDDPIEALEKFLSGGSAGSGGAGGGAGAPGGSVRILDGGARVEFGPGAGGLGGAVIFSGPAAQAAIRAMDLVRKAGGTPKQAAEAGVIEAAKHSGGGGALKPRGGRRSGPTGDGKGVDQFGIFGIGQSLEFEFVDREGDPFSFFGADNPLLFEFVDRESRDGDPFGGFFGIGGNR